MIEMLGRTAVSDQLSENIRLLVAAFVSSEYTGRRYLLGCNEHALALSHMIEINAFVDDFAEPGVVLNGKPVIRGDKVPSDAIVVNCSLSISPVTAHRRIESLPVAGVLAYSDLCKSFPERFSYPAFVLEMRKDFEEHYNKWTSVYESLADDRSRQVMSDLIRFRMTGDFRHMHSYLIRLHEQYFEDFLGLGAGEIFVDAGGFDGDTTEEFCRRCPGYEKVILFEPSLHNLASAQIRLSEYRSIEFIQRGLSDENGTLWFNPDAGSASSVSSSGTCQIEVTTLDRQISDKVTFIKMDLEGWELKALAGSKRHILEDHPKLAISVYHHASDFWRIFEFVMGIRQDYDVYLRHYTEGWSETVMFFVPKNMEGVNCH